MKKFALIVAGGVGKRMGAETPKQFMELSGQPILMHTIAAFYQYDHRMEIILVLPLTHFNQWTELCLKYDFDIPHKMVAGGSTRFHSVKNGLESISSPEGLVGIHDGVRPLITADIIGDSYEVAADKGNAVVAVALKDTIRFTEKASNKAVDRSMYRAIQTPQTFSLSQIKAAYNIEFDESITDDAFVAEKAGQKIHLIEGSYRNIKITTMEDLVVAEALMANK